MNRNMKIAAALTAAGAALTLTACTTDADVASENVSKAADNFEVNRRIVMFNGITDAVLLEIVGPCSIKAEPKQLEVICKTDKGFKKHFLGLSDNVSYLVEQGSPVKASTSQYRVTVKPSTVVPDFDVR